MNKTIVLIIGIILLISCALLIHSQLPLEEYPVLIYGHTYPNERVIIKLNDVKKEAQSNEYGEYAITFESKDIFKKTVFGYIQVNNKIEFWCRDKHFIVDKYRFDRLSTLEVNI